jgi:tripartite-type tricarboxylate transporter receptor subunit TctC
MGSRVIRGILIAGIAACAAAWGGDVRAQVSEPYPGRPVRIVANFAVGGAIDAVARAVGAKLGESMGQQFVVENRPGAGGNIGADAVAKAKPDGYMLLCTLDTTLTVNPSLYGTLPFDPAKDFDPITLAAAAPLVLLTHPTLPAADVKSFVALAKARGGALKFASGGSGSAGHLAGVLLGQIAGFEFLHVPYKGGPQAVTDLAAGQTDFTILSFTVTAGLIKGEKVRALAVTGPQRAPAYPELPTIAESGYPRYEVVFWIGFLAPAGTPKAVLARLHAEIVKALPQPEVRNVLALQGFETVGNSPDAFATVIERDRARWTKIVRETGARAD